MNDRDITYVGPLREEPPPPATTPAERLAMMWRLALDAYGFAEPDQAEPRLQRHAVRVLRRGS